ncbi:putative bifunctional diguanylate cyclase/phosphodiesterase [Roseibium aggregatum]|uniref:EAL domain-containing protein n=1 Tax=Roseibium aggregatum TaxID=187304 RepID=A0A926P1A4_9HYPH|nr:EAL domain-containing protein [Roseibium aggregatum]MBD1547138.1 EAL domain-containing protein [Roseibium aggregatum]
MGTTLQISIDDIPDGVLICDRTGTIQAFNGALEQIFGYAREDLIGRKIEILVPDRFAGHAKLRETYALNPVSRPMGSVQRIFGRRKDGSEIPLDISLSKLNANGDIICFARDVSEHVRLAEEIRKSAYFDPVTGALNRRAFNEDLAEAMSGIDARANGVCIGLFDLDHFKDVNDTLGHSVGDKLLVAFCDRLREVMHEKMRLYRIGGDEFALILPTCADPQNAFAFVETAIWNVRKPVFIGAHEITIGCSAGVVHAPENGITPDELMSNADLALYEAKIIRGRVSRFTPDLREAVEERFALMPELKAALEKDQFELHFQPQIDIRSGRTVGAEALLRWNHPKRGLLAPDCFIDLITGSEMSVSIGRWVLFQACAQAQKWRALAGRPLKIAVNLFPRQTYSKSLVNDVTWALADTGLDAGSLELELTENTILDSSDNFIEVLGYLRGLGVTIGLDDFGTGYASLNSLTRYPVDTIKVDRSFVSGSAGKPENQAVLRTMVMLAREFGLVSVAEGVETAEEAQIIQQIGFNLGQGYNWSRPISGPEFEKLLKSGGRKPPAAATGQAEASDDREIQAVGMPDIHGRSRQVSV